MINEKVKETPWLLAGGLAQLVYGLGEIGDTLYLLFLQAHWLPNFYPAWTFPEAEGLMRSQPAVLFPAFAFFAIGRVVASCAITCGASG